MFQATIFPYSGEITVSMWYLVPVTVWMTVWYAGWNEPCIPDSHPHRVTSTKCCIDTVISPDDGHIVAWNMQRKEINILRKIVYQVGFIYKMMMFSLKLKQKFNCQIIYKQKLFEIIKITIEPLLTQQRALWPVWTKPRYCCLLLQEVAVSSKIMESIYKTPQFQNPKHHNLSTPPIIKSSYLI